MATSDRSHWSPALLSCVQRAQLDAIRRLDAHIEKHGHVVNLWIAERRQIQGEHVNRSFGQMLRFFKRRTQRRVLRHKFPSLSLRSLTRTKEPHHE